MSLHHLEVKISITKWWHFVSRNLREQKMDVGGDCRAPRRMRNACEKAKKRLSFTDSVDIEIDCLFSTTDFCVTFSREKFESINVDLFEKCMEPVEMCLRDAKMGTSSVDDIVLIGGSSRIPKVQQLLKDVFKGKELCKGINQEEAVANGAAVLAAVLNGNNNSACKLKDFTLMDVTPLSLGNRTGRLLAGDQNIMSVMIPRNTRIPVKMYRTYGNQEGQAATGFYIFEGESENTLKNSLLGSFTLNDLPPSPADELKFEVFFDIDASGILKVSAEEESTGQKKWITVATYK